MRILPLILALAACHAKAPPVTQVPHGGGFESAVEAPKTVPEAVEALKANFARVHFDYDSARLSADARAALAANAAILQQFPEIRVEVQGHADDRGTVDYNLALGERRATAVVDALKSLGAPVRGLTTVSYGEERPLTSGAGESVWSENRRAEFRVIAGAPGVSGTIL